jgi:hypothetical protein
MEYRFRPLSDWRGPKTAPEDRRSRGAFKASWSATLDLLDRELWMLEAELLVIEADFREQDLRLDGMIRANARPGEFPGVRLAFEAKHLGPLIYQVDSCMFWQHNVRSIALGLEALRSIKRWGIAEHGEQYKGWLAIEPPRDGVPTTTTEAHEVISRFGSVAEALRRTHPDHGGDPEEFRRVLAAKRILQPQPGRKIHG